MDMRITHADADKNELRFFDFIEKYDAQVSIAPGAVLVDNSFSLSLADHDWQSRPILKGHFLYIDGTEWGGPVEEVTHNTGTGVITLSGPTWRGMLMRKIINPPAGQGYLTVSGEANTVIASVLGTSMGGLFTVSTTNTGINLNASWRYQKMHDALEKALEAAGLTLDIKYSAALKTVLIAARAVVDHSATVDLSQDYGIAMRSIQGRMDGYNHIIALGAGELQDRDVLHVYRLANGTITTTAPAWAGTAQDMVTVYDYSNPESLADLLAGAAKRLQEMAPLDGVEIDPSDADIELPMGDIVGARDRLTGLTATARIIEKILVIDQSGTKIDTKVG